MLRSAAIRSSPSPWTPAIISRPSVTCKKRLHLHQWAGILSIESLSRHEILHSKPSSSTSPNSPSRRRHHHTPGIVQVAGLQSRQLPGPRCGDVILDLKHLKDSLHHYLLVTGYWSPAAGCFTRPFALCINCSNCSNSLAHVLIQRLLLLHESRQYIPSVSNLPSVERHPSRRYIQHIKRSTCEHLHRSGRRLNHQSRTSYAHRASQICSRHDADMMQTTLPLKPTLSFCLECLAQDASLRTPRSGCSSPCK